MFLTSFDDSNRISEIKRQIIMQAWIPWIIASVISAILIYVASAIGLMKMFEKAGEKNWKA